MVKATIVLHNDVSTARLEVDVMDEDVHDGILRPLRREGHRPQVDATAVRELFK